MCLQEPHLVKLPCKMLNVEISKIIFLSTIHIFEFLPYSSADRNTQKYKYNNSTRAFEAITDFLSKEELGLGK